MLPIVWLLGPSGVGKSTTAYRMLSELADAGVAAAYVDADQLRLANGVHASETELIASALPALDHRYRAHGARVLIVAGLADDRDHLAALLPGVPRHRVLVVHLGAEADTIRERIRRRGWLIELTEESVDYATRIDPDIADLHLDTTGQPPAALAARVTEATLAWLGQASDGRQPTDGNQETEPCRPAVPAPRRVIVLTGPGGVGLSTVGFQMFIRLARDHEPVAYLDAHQLGFLGTDVRGDHLAPLRAANAHTLAGCLAHGGATTVVVSGDPRTAQHLDGAWDPEIVTVFWLHASAAVLAQRITQRARGNGPAIQGDHRIGLTGNALTEAITTAIGESERPGLRPAGARFIDTSTADPVQIAETIAASLTTMRPTQ